ncbi:tetratricopeptide repeat-containing diguanylate cyclase [Senegalia massiliensis]|uniref:Diguanylate cyclase n=1 Tax=Senegalia massiliensis TaxID=1720316 RepID=A0A845R131_9CLOT|nr:diguanylate cyclase [Senegalia massiliensis]NBI06273.1 diguanylate cyclase [Senegalia massiliensis]
MIAIKNISEEIYNKINYAKSIVSIYPDEAIKISKDACNLAKSSNLIIEEAYAFLSISLGSRIKSDISNILDYSYKALVIFRQENHIVGQGKSLNLIGIAYFYSSMYEEAIKNFLEADNLLKFNKDKSLVSSVLNNIGEVYRELEMYDKAVYYYNKAIDTIFENNYTLNHAAILGNIGEVHFTKKEYKKALDVFNKSYKLLACDNDMISIGELENRIGQVYFVMKNFEKAKEYYFRSFKRLQNINNKYYVIDVLINIAELYIEMSTGRALNFYEKAMEFAEIVGSKNKLCNIYRLISEYHEKEEDYKNALEYYKKYSNINQEIMSSKIKSKLEILNIEFKNIDEKVEVEKIRIRLENEISRQKYELKNIKDSNKMLEKKVYEDDLTGIKNRRSINLYLKNILNKTSKSLVALFIIDIDKFKRYNDYWGHVQGDLCIKKVVDCIKRIQVKKDDTFGRYGGEEFVYISTSINYEEAFKLANIIRMEVENSGLYYIYKGEKKFITISIGGVVGNNSDFDSIQDIMELADKELYRAKNMGRNRVFLRKVIS